MISQKLQLNFLLGLLFGSLLLSFFIFKPFLAPLALPAVFTVILKPLHRQLLTRVRFKSVAALATVLIGVVGILVPLSLLGVQVFEEAHQLYNNLAAGQRANTLITVIESSGRSLDRFIPGLANLTQSASANLDTYARQGLAWIINHLGGVLSSLSFLLLQLFVFMMALYYLLRDGHQLKSAIIALSPLNDKSDEFIFGRLKLAVNSVVRGNLTIAAIQGVLAAIGFTIFGLPNGVLWGTLAAVASLIPGLGTLLVTLPAILYLGLSGQTGAALGLLVWAGVVVGLVDNFVGPRLIGRGLQLHPLLTLLSVLGGLAFFGPVGVFLGPLSLSLLFAFISIYTALWKSPATNHEA